MRICPGWCVAQPSVAAAVQPLETSYSRNLNSWTSRVRGDEFLIEIHKLFWVYNHRKTIYPRKYHIVVDEDVLILVCGRKKKAQA